MVVAIAVAHVAVYFVPAVDLVVEAAVVVVPALVGVVVIVFVVVLLKIFFVSCQLFLSEDAEALPFLYFGR